MKKILLSLSAIALLAFSSVKAQTIPNLGFETWTPNTFSAGMAPDPNNGNANNGWWEFNVLSDALLGSSPITVLEGSSNPAPFAGTHYAEIVSDSMSKTSYGYLKGYGYNYPRTNGFMFLAYFNVGFTGATIKAGVPFSGKLTSFSFNYRYVPNGSDSCSCTIAMFHWNSVTHKRDLIGGGAWGSTTPQTTWAPITVPVFYDSATSMPDTVFILFSATKLDSANGPKRGDTLDIDNGSVTVGINNLASENATVRIYPNPANTQITMAVTSQLQGNHVEVYDITGKLMGTYTMHNNLLTINTQLFNTGLYLYKMYDNTGTQLNVGKFSVVK